MPAVSHADSDTPATSGAACLGWESQASVETLAPVSLAHPIDAIGRDVPSRTTFNRVAGLLWNLVRRSWAHPVTTTIRLATRTSSRTLLLSRRWPRLVRLGARTQRRWRPRATEGSLDFLCGNIPSCSGLGYGEIRRVQVGDEFGYSVSRTNREGSMRQPRPTDGPLRRNLGGAAPEVRRRRKHCGGHVWGERV